MSTQEPMYKTQRLTDLGAREMDEIERRRQRLAARTERILNAKQRLIGIETDALDLQVAERREREQLERERDQQYDARSLEAAQIQKDVQAEEYRRTLVANYEQRAFLLRQAQEKRQREVVEAAQCDNYYDMDTQFLKFPGEDLGYNDRKQYQQRQQKEWLEQQVEMLRERERFENQEDRNYDARQEEIASIIKSNDDEVAQSRRQRNLEVMRFNKNLAREKQLRERKYAAEQEDAAQNEVMRTFHSKQLNEVVGPRDGRSNFKGFTPQMRQEVLDTQARQIEELRAQRERELYEDQQYDEMQEGFRRTIVAIDQQVARDKAQELADLRRERARQAKEKTAHYNYLDTVVYKNPVDESYFQQWQQGCR